MQKNLKTILKILSDGKHHSGANLGNQLKLTRSAIWKLIKQLEKCGIKIEAKTNLGYRIPSGLELLDKKNILKYLDKKNQTVANKIVIFDEVDSTNNFLATQKKTKYKICFAEFQSAGKGRLGRIWVSPFAQNIYLSLLQQFTLKPHELSSLGLVIAVAIVGALKKYGIKKGIGLKWPNDILWDKKKLAGILIELSGETHHIYKVIIGIGLNVNMSQESGKKITKSWCDISQITKTKPKRNKLAGLLLNHILVAIADYQKNGLAQFIKKWQKLDTTYGKKVTLITPQRKIKGIACGIDKNGYFLLKDNTGKLQTFASGEVSLRIS